MSHGTYRKRNDGSMSSSTYHKQDGTPVRQLLKREAQAEVAEAVVGTAIKSTGQEVSPSQQRCSTGAAVATDSHGDTDGGRWVVCAAVRYPDGTMLVGPRHFDATMQAQYRRLGLRFEEDECEKGFLDQSGDFMTREAAYRVAEAQGQIRYQGASNGRRLFSEDIY